MCSHDTAEYYRKYLGSYEGTRLYIHETVEPHAFKWVNSDNPDQWIHMFSKGSHSNSLHSVGEHGSTWGAYVDTHHWDFYDSGKFAYQKMMAYALQHQTGYPMDGQLQKAQTEVILGMINPDFIQPGYDREVDADITIFV